MVKGGGRSGPRGGTFVAAPSGKTSQSQWQLSKETLTKLRLKMLSHLCYNFSRIVEMRVISQYCAKVTVNIQRQITFLLLSNFNRTQVVFGNLSMQRCVIVQHQRFSVALIRCCVHFESVPAMAMRSQFEIGKSWTDNISELQICDNKKKKQTNKIEHFARRIPHPSEIFNGLSKCRSLCCRCCCCC